MKNEAIPLSNRETVSTVFELIDEQETGRFYFYQKPIFLTSGGFTPREKPWQWERKHHNKPASFPVVVYPIFRRFG